MKALSPLQVERLYQAPIEKVWEIVTTQKYLTQWLMPGNFKAEIGYEYEFLCDPPEGFDNWDGRVYGKVLEVNKPNSIVFTWSNSRLLQETTVKFLLSATDAGVLFTVEHTGFSNEDTQEYELHSNGWVHHLDQIEKSI